MKKTELVIFRLTKLKIDHSFKFKWNGQIVALTHSVKYLEVLIDEHLLWNKQIVEIKIRLIHAIYMLRNLRINTNFNILKTAYHSLSESHLNMVDNYGTKKTTKQHSRRLKIKILKFPYILNLQNCILMYQIQNSLKFCVSFPALHAKDKHNYNTRSATQNLLDIALTKTSMYSKDSINTKNHCIRDWDKLKKDVSDILDSELAFSKIHKNLK